MEIKISDKLIFIKIEKQDAVAKATTGGDLEGFAVQDEDSSVAIVFDSDEEKEYFKKYVNEKL